MVGGEETHRSAAAAALTPTRDGGRNHTEFFALQVNRKHNKLCGRRKK
jgi:hypothetical protein